MNIKYKLKEVKPKVFLVEFEDQYDMCMTFLHAQETYESPNPKFRNKEFTIEEFMRWYSKAYGNGAFTYPVDWSGFNVPSYILDKLFGSLTELGPNNLNVYDQTLFKIYCSTQYKVADKYGLPDTGAPKFYLIGALKGNAKTIQHEVAHGFWFTKPKYKKEMLALVKKMKPALRKKLCNELAKIGYTKQVFDDECHAYMSTGLSDKFGITLKNEDKPFIEVFKRHYNE